MAAPNKSLGQHWLKDRTMLAAIADSVEITKDITVLEIGPGLGTLTSELLRRAGRVVAVEFDAALAHKLPGQFPGKNLEVINADILSFDTSALPKGYVVVANIPYYITAKIVQKLVTDPNPPAQVAILIQQEVAERLAARPGDMSLLALQAQLFADVELGPIVAKEYFTPPPKVESQVVILRMLPTPRVPVIQHKALFQVAKAGFSAKRKKLRSSLAGGLALDKALVEASLKRCHIAPDARAEELSIQDWQRLALDIKKH